MGFNDSLVHLKDTTTFFNGDFNAQSVTITISNALALYNALELLLLIFTTFRRHRGLYFWSLVVATVGVFPYCIGFMIGYYRLTSQIASGVLSSVGWPMLITGQSFVLYSRLGVVLGPCNERVLKAVKWMIIIDGIVFHTSTTVVMFGAYNAHPNHAFAQAYKYIEKVQMTGFTIQEFILSGLYVWRTLDILKTSSDDWSRRGKRIMRELFIINILIIFMDIALLVVEFQDRHTIEQAIKEVVYSVKLKLEFAILSKLVSITQRNDDNETVGIFGDGETHDNEKPMQNGSLSLQPFQTDAEVEKAKMNGDAMHVERASSWLSGTTYLEENPTSNQLQALPSTTSDEQRRRRTLEDNLYAGACRDIG